jgi:hypothetical protein
MSLKYQAIRLKNTLMAIKVKKNGLLASKHYILLDKTVLSRIKVCQPS